MGGGLTIPDKWYSSCVVPVVLDLLKLRHMKFKLWEIPEFWCNAER